MGLVIYYLMHFIIHYCLTTIILVYLGLVPPTSLSFFTSIGCSWWMPTVLCMLCSCSTGSIAVPIYLLLFYSCSWLILSLFLSPRFPVPIFLSPHSELPSAFSLLFLFPISAFLPSDPIGRSRVAHPLPVASSGSVRKSAASHLYPFLITGYTLCYNLPDDLKNCRSVDTFKFMYKRVFNNLGWNCV